MYEPDQNTAHTPAHSAHSIHIQSTASSAGLKNKSKREKKKEGRKRKPLFQQAVTAPAVSMLGEQFW